MNSKKNIINWLLNTDSSVRYQTLKDLLSTSANEINKEQELIAQQGWGKKILDLQDPKGTWANGLYTPKWTSTTYTLLLLRRIGLKQDNPQAKTGAEILLNKGYYKDGGISGY